MPDVSKQQLEELKEESDPLLNFKIEVFDKQHPTRIPTQAVYHYYTQYQRMNNQRNTMSPQRFIVGFSKLISGKYEKKPALIKNTDWAFSGVFPNDITEDELLQYIGKGLPQCFVIKKTPHK